MNENMLCRSPRFHYRGGASGDHATPGLAPSGVRAVEQPVIHIHLQLGSQ